MYERFFKRFLDIIISGIALIFLSPLYLLLGVYVVVFMGWPILFGQERTGKGEKPFMLYKFRSMTNKKDEDGNLLPEEKRLTLAGKILRSTSLDELPELWSILIGDMSIVGPRPLPTYYLPYYYPNERIKHKVRGGLIPPDGLSLNPDTSYEEQFKYECYYADHVSLWLDIKVILYTFVIIIKRITSDYGGGFRPHLNVYRAEEFKKNPSKFQL